MKDAEKKFDTTVAGRYINVKIVRTLTAAAS
jgi:hypothetical protein